MSTALHHPASYHFSEVSKFPTLSLSLFFKLVSLVYGGRAYETSRSQVTALVEITMEGGRVEAPGTLRNPGNTVWVLLPKML